MGATTGSSLLGGATVLVLGLGESGLAMARWCGRAGAAVRVWDSRETPPNAAALAAMLPGATRVSGPLTDAAFAGVGLVLKSPGLSPLDARIREPLERIGAAGVPVWGELDLFARALAELRAGCGYAPRVLAITGTNGKTTTTHMAAQLIGRAGRRVAVAGNIGPTMLQTLMDALEQEPAAEAGRQDTADAAEVAGLPVDVDAPLDVDMPMDVHMPVDVATPLDVDAPADGLPAADVLVPAASDTSADEALPVVPALPAAPLAPTFDHLPEVWVLELSSFQLDSVTGFEPSAAAVLNLTEDHLDWHGSMAAYAAAKQRIFGLQAVLVINRDDAVVESLIPVLPASAAIVAGKSGAKTAARGRGRSTPPERRIVRFGLDAPQRPGDFGLVEENGIAWLVRAREQDATARPSRGGRGLAAAEAEPIQIQRLMPADALRVRGRHNAANALAALALGVAIDCPLAPMLHGLREYCGEPHRLQFVASAGGVDAYDDSKGTNVGATVAALNGLGADRAPARLAVVLGGEGKGQDFAPLAEPVRRHARAVGLIGRDAAAIEQALAATGVLLQRHESLQAATRWCFEQAQAGDAVLLSPACASFDMFRHYGHRAEVFVAEVLALASEAGGVVA